MTLKTNGITVDLKASAISYAKKGWPVFPVHYPNNGECSCGKPNCTSQAKHPLTPRGLKDATTDLGTIAALWSRWPNANIGIVTGRVSGIVVVDVDAKSGGLETWAELQDIHGRVDTLTAVTGGGGRHFFFVAPSGLDLKSTAGVLGAGIDTRAEGGYIVAPPSMHISGDRYEVGQQTQRFQHVVWIDYFGPIRDFVRNDDVIRHPYRVESHLLSLHRHPR